MKAYFIPINIFKNRIQIIYFYIRINDTKVNQIPLKFHNILFHIIQTLSIRSLSFTNVMKKVRKETNSLVIVKGVFITFQYVHVHFKLL